MLSSEKPENVRQRSPSLEAVSKAGEEPVTVCSPLPPEAVEWLGVLGRRSAWQKIRVVLRPVGHDVGATMDLLDRGEWNLTLARVSLRSCRIAFVLPSHALAFEGKFRDGVLAGVVMDSSAEPPRFSGSNFYLAQLSGPGGAEENELSGLFRMEDGRELVLGRYEQRFVYLDLSNRRSELLSKAAGGVFYSQSGVTFTLTRDEQGHVAGLTWNRPAQPIMMGRKIHLIE